MKNSTTGYKGVTRTRAIKVRYESYLVLYNNNSNKRIKYYIGTFDTPELAYIARVRYIDSLK